VTEVTRAVFRKWGAREGGGVIALFPDICEGPGRVSSYEHTGQHGGADYDGVVRRTVPASPQEYATLKRELEAAPFYYTLKAVKRR
jgi:hypothetical protein